MIGCWQIVRLCCCNHWDKLWCSDYRRDGWLVGHMPSRKMTAGSVVLANGGVFGKQCKWSVPNKHRWIPMINRLVLVGNYKCKHLTTLMNTFSLDWHEYCCWGWLIGAGDCLWLVNQSNDGAEVSLVEWFEVDACWSMLVGSRSTGFCCRLPMSSRRAEQHNHWVRVIPLLSAEGVERKRSEPVGKYRKIWEITWSNW